MVFVIEKKVIYKMYDVYKERVRLNLRREQLF